MVVSDRETRLQELLEPTLVAMGYGLVRVQVTGGSQPTLQVMAERDDGKAMSIDDCTRISRALSEKLDADDPIESAYSLEVSSPGIERPLVRPADYKRFQGCQARVETKMKIAERRKFVGVILGATGTHVRMRLDLPAKSPKGAVPEDVEIDFAQITRARLAPVDPAIAADDKPSPKAQRDNRSNGIVRQ